MNIFNILTLLGGLAMFLYGMRLMGDGLKESSSGTLKRAMENVTNNPIKAFLLGLAVTAVIQSSTATIVITSGLVGAGIISLRQSLGIIVGANVGTTATGQIIRLLDLDASSVAWLQIFKPSTLAPVALIIGIVLIMGFSFKSSKSIGSIAIGFGILFTGLLNMTGSVDALNETGIFETLFAGLGARPLLGYLTGAGVAFVLQSSSATVGILQALSASGQLTFSAVYAVIVGIYLGDCVTTAIVCSIGAKEDARRVGMVNILFNLSETVLVLVGVAIVHKLGLIDALWDRAVTSGDIANTNTVFNFTCAILLLPMLPVYERISRRLVHDKAAPANKYAEKLEALSPAFFNTPALALRSCYDLLLTILRASRQNIDLALSMLGHYSDETMRQLEEEEDNIDLMTDRACSYLVELSTHISASEHVSILDQYYKLVSEFERLGDHAVNIAELAQSMDGSEEHFSSAAMQELGVLQDLIGRILDLADRAFEKRDIEAAKGIEPLEEVVDDMVNALRDNHLDRVCAGQCSVVAGTSFMNLMSDIERISDICSNIGVATVARVRPELALRAHEYISRLHSGDDESFNVEYNRAHDEYFSRLVKQA